MSRYSIHPMEEKFIKDTQGVSFDSTPDLPITHAYIVELIETLRISRECLDNDEFSLCAGAIDSAVEICSHLKHFVNSSGSNYIHKSILFGTK